MIFLSNRCAHRTKIMSSLSQFSKAFQRGYLEVLGSFVLRFLIKIREPVAVLYLLSFIFIYLLAIPQILQSPLLHYIIHWPLLHTSKPSIITHTLSRPLRPRFLLIPLLQPVPIPSNTTPASTPPKSSSASPPHPSTGPPSP